MGARATTQTAMADNKLAGWASLRYLIHASSPVFASSFMPATSGTVASVQAGAGEDLLGPDDPETLGRASARHYQQQLKQYQDADRLLSQDADRPLNLWVPAWGKR